MTKKKDNKYFESIRKTWIINPVTKVKGSKKVYSRKNYRAKEEE